MLKKHLFLVIAAAMIVLMIVFGAVKVMTGTRSAGPGGPGGAGGFAGGPGGPAGGGFGGGGARRGTQVTPAVIGVRSFSDRIEVLGQAKAQQSITLTAPASQLVTKISFQSGQFVRRGQVLAELNATEQQAAILQARSQVALAKSNWDRWQQLADRGIAPAATAEGYKAQYEQAVATLQANQARAGDRVIRAPFAGVVGLTDAAPGMLLNAGGAIATLDDLSVIRVDFPVPEQYISLLHDGLPIRATADAYPGVTFTGRIARLDTRLDPTTRSMTARAEFQNPDRRLRPGMLMRVNVDQASRTNPAAPESSVVFEGGESYVLVITPAPAGAGQRPGGAGGPGAAQAAAVRGGGNAQGGGQRAQGRPGGGQGGPSFIAARRTVQTGVRADGWVEILAGLQPGERIVADGTNRVRPNDPISVIGGGRQGQGQGAGAGAPAGGGQGGFGGPRPSGAVAEGAGAAPASGLRQAGSAGPAPTGGPAGGPGAGFNPQAMFQRADANGDGALTVAEWTGAGRPQQAFSRLDTNSDGKITLPEMQQTRARSAGGAGGAG